jgi:hypothetical protein
VCVCVCVCVIERTRRYCADIDHTPNGVCVHIHISIWVDVAKEHNLCTIAYLTGETGYGLQNRQYTQSGYT